MTKKPQTHNLKICEFAVKILLVNLKLLVFLRYDLHCFAANLF